MTLPAHIRRRNRERGLTLIELVAAMALFALVAVMSLQALTGMLRLNNRLEGTAADTLQTSLALTLLRRDMRAMVPVVFAAPDGAVQSAFDASQAGALAFSVGGQPVMDNTSGVGLQRIIWRIDAERQSLMRQVWPVLQPARENLLAPEVVMLTGVSGMAVRSYDWRVGWRIGGGDTGSFSDTLPGAVEVTLATSAGPLRLLVTLQ